MQIASKPGTRLQSNLKPTNIQTNFKSIETCTSSIPSLIAQIEIINKSGTSQRDLSQQIEIEKYLLIQGVGTYTRRNYRPALRAQAANNLVVVLRTLI